MNWIKINKLFKWKIHELNELITIRNIIRILSSLLYAEQSKKLIVESVGKCYKPIGVFKISQFFMYHIMIISIKKLSYEWIMYWSTKDNGEKICNSFCSKIITAKKIPSVTGSII